MSQESLAGRLFLAVKVEPEIGRRLERHLRERRDGRSLPGRRVDPETLHVTLRFLDQVDEETAQRVVAAMDDLELPQAFELLLSDLGAFPRARHGRVIWLGCREGRASLQSMAKACDQAARSAGLPPERLPFKAHVTLSRLPSPMDLRVLLKAGDGFVAGQPVTELRLYRSHLEPGGPRYEVLKRWTLPPLAE